MGAAGLFGAGGGLLWDGGSTHSKLKARCIACSEEARCSPTKFRNEHTTFANKRAW